MSDVIKQNGIQERTSLLGSVRALLAGERQVADSERRAAFRPDLSSVEGYAASLSPYRDALRQMLGWPLTGSLPPASAECHLISSDELGRIYRVRVEVHPLVKTASLLFLPRLEGPHPLVIAQHGGKGTPELAAGLLDGGSDNYNKMIPTGRPSGFS